MRRSSLLPTLVTLAGLFALVGPLPAMAQPPAGPGAPPPRMERRIERGVRRGELIRPEARHLRRDVRGFRRHEWRCRRDGKVSPMERHGLRRHGRHLSREIWRLRHNHFRHF